MGNLAGHASTKIELRRRAVCVSLAAALLQASLAACGKKEKRGRLVPPGATVLALGDSITFGTGAPKDASYPSVLTRLSGWNVINAGVPGDVSAQALQRLAALLKEHGPELVLLSIGGNDFLRRVSEAETRDNIRQICEQVLATGAQLLLIAVPRPSLAAAAVRSLSDHELYAKLAQQLELPLYAQGWAEVLGDDALRSDAIHANALGYERFARGLAARAQALGMLAATA